MIRKNGFTLLELIIAVVIVGILASLAIPAFQGAIIKAKLVEIYIAVNYWEKEIELAALEYGWENWSAIYDESMRVDAEISAGSDIRYYASNDPSESPRGHRLRMKAGSSVSPLCTRLIYYDRKEWTITDAHPWAKYLTIPGAMHE